MAERVPFPIAAGIVGVMALAACGPPGDPPAGAEGRPGYSQFSRTCARCHGDDGRSERASRIARETVDLTDPAWRRKTPFAEIERIVREGKGRMNGLGDRLSPDEIRDVARYTLWLSATVDSLRRIERRSGSSAGAAP